MTALTKEVVLITTWSSHAAEHSNAWKQLRDSSHLSHYSPGFGSVVVTWSHQLIIPLAIDRNSTRCLPKVDTEFLVEASLLQSDRTLEKRCLADALYLQQASDIRAGN